jgi:lipopolysaccharide transport system permease protein
MLPDWALEYARYRELFIFLVWRDVKIRYKQTLLGAVWAVLQPFLMMIVFTLIFGRVAKLDSQGLPYPLFYYSAMVPWTFFAQGVPLSSNSLVVNSKLISKVYFPRAIIPTASALAGVVDFFVASLVLVGMMIYYHFPFGWELLFWPILVLPLAVLVVAIGMYFSSLNVKYRDIKYTIPFFVQMMLFISGIIYSSDAIPAQYQKFLVLNPMIGIINAFRACMDPARLIDWNQVGLSCVVISVLFILAATYFRKAERAFADLI